MKFGGTSVRDAQAFERVARIVATRRDRHPVVVVSAMSRVTDALVACAEAAKRSTGTHESEVARVVERIVVEHLDEHLTRHRVVARELLSADGQATFALSLESARAEISDLLRTAILAASSMHALLQDSVVSHGERLSSALLTFVLKARDLPARFVDARRCVVTNDDYGRAIPHVAETRRATNRELAPLIADGFVPVVGGFIAASTDGATTTLGRNGSDYSATIIGAALGAGAIEIWTDTAGVLTADPRLVPTAHTVPRLSYKEAADLARAGAKVLHPETIRPLVEPAIPLHVRNSQASEEPGTIISADAATPGAKSITLKRNLTTLRVTPAPAGDDKAFVECVCNVMTRQRESLDLCIVSHAGAFFVASEQAAASIAAEIEAGSVATSYVERGRALITVVGEGMESSAETHARTLRAFGRAGVFAIAHGASTAARSFVIEEARAAEALANLHRELFERKPFDDDPRDLL